MTAVLSVFISLSPDTPSMIIVGTLLLLGLGYALFSSLHTNAIISSVGKTVPWYRVRKGSHNAFDRTGALGGDRHVLSLGSSRSSCRISSKLFGVYHSSQVGFFDFRCSLYNWYVCFLFPSNHPLMTRSHNNYHPPFSITSYAETCLWI